MSRTIRRAKRVCLALALLASISLAGAIASASEPHVHPAAQELTLEPAPPSPDSIYQLESRWTNAAGDEVPFASLAGRVQVIAMIYTHCEHACPRIIADMKQLQRELGDADGRVGYVLVSLDPDRDSVERLASFAQQTQLADHWTLLRADDSAVRELAAVLGIRYRRVSDTDFVHSNLLSVVDPEGVVVHRQVGLGVDPHASVAAIREVLARGD